MITVFGQENIWRVRIATLAQKFSVLIGAVVGLTVGVLIGEIIVLGTVGGGVALTMFHFTETYFLRLDSKLFDTPGMSKRELFDRHFAKQVAQDLGLQMTEPDALVTNLGMNTETRRSLFNDRLQSQLEREFHAFDWEYFVREVIRYK